MDKRRPNRAKNPKPGHRDVFAERIGHEIDRMAQRGQRTDAVESLNGVPRGSKNGSGAIIRMRMR